MQRLTIGTKIWLACGLIALMAAAIGASALAGVSRINGAAGTLSSGALPGSYLAGRLNTGAKAILIRMNLHMQSNSEEKQARYESYLEQRADQWRQEAKAYESIASDRERALIASAKSDFERLLAAWRGILPVSKAHQHQEAFAVYEREGMAIGDRLDETLKSLVITNKELADMAARDAESTARRVGLEVVWALALSLAGGGVLAFRIVRGVNRSLRQSVRELSRSSKQVAAAASQIAASSQGLAQGASEQSASLQDTSASAEQIHATAERNASHSQDAVDLVASTRTGFAEADRSLGQMIQAMDEINQSSGKISKIIKAIDEIAFQTNILALNAAVEAARAGEAGMGFAVVADEVRNLAHRSAQAARDTTALIEESVSKSASGRAQVAEVARSIQLVTGSARKIQTLVEEVSLGSREQVRGIDQIAKAMAQMDQVTQQTAANAEQGAAAAEELSAQSATLDGIVRELTALVERE
ncbi:MAG TPA: methyl-accepting chemotaxis protein [Candidatus Acidoferrales bacterium]|nr:methyl-accepting chemotaxis protein [Candidatus Acidoferrales bacterium]